MKQSRIRRGNVAELLVAAQASEYNIAVCTPLSHHSYYDLIFDNEDRLYRIQVKRVYLANNHGNKVPCIETRRIYKNQTNPYPENAYDFLIACDCDTKDMWIIPFAVTTQYKAQIYLNSKEEFKNQWSVLGVDVSS